MPYAFATFESEMGAISCVEQDGKPFQGRILKINHKMRKNMVKEDKDCWFCYSNPKIDSQLIISPKDAPGEFYLAVPKGPVTDEHFLVVPKQHIAHSLELSPAQSVNY